MSVVEDDLVGVIDRRLVGSGHGDFPCQLAFRVPRPVVRQQPGLFRLGIGIDELSVEDGVEDHLGGLRAVVREDDLCRDVRVVEFVVVVPLHLGVIPVQAAAFGLRHGRGDRHGFRDLDRGGLPGAEPRAGALAQDVAVLFDLVWRGGEGKIERVAEADAVPQRRVSGRLAEGEPFLHGGGPGGDEFIVRFGGCDRQLKDVPFPHGELSGGLVLHVVHPGRGPQGRARGNAFIIIHVVIDRAVGQNFRLPHDGGPAAGRTQVGRLARVCEVVEEALERHAFREGGKRGGEDHVRESGDELDLGVLEVLEVVHDGGGRVDRELAVVLEVDAVEGRPGDVLGEIAHPDGAEVSLRSFDDLNFLGRLRLPFGVRRRGFAVGQALRADLRHIVLPDGDVAVVGLNREEQRAERRLGGDGRPV